jgi:spermidine/putrescine-binding protein
MKKLFSLFLLIIVFICAGRGAIPAIEPADMPEGTEEAAWELANLGLLRGVGQGFALETPCDRLQGAALFTRLLGQEEEATAHVRPHPFLDISANNWAASYVAYLYNRGLAYGQAYNEYGRGVMTPHQFATFCLRALDYTEGNENSDFQWSEALDFMVQQRIISGSLRNRLAATPVFRRGDAVLLAYATLSAELKEGKQTLLQRLLEQGAVTAEQAAGFGGWPATLRLAYPKGLLDQNLLKNLAVEQGITVFSHPYETGTEEDIYRQLRQEERSFDICALPGYIVDYLRADELLIHIPLGDFGGEEAFIPVLRDNPYWYDKERRRYYALPLAFEIPLLYYDSARVKSPDWSWLFRAGYSGSVYMPADSSMLIPLALHYYNLPYDTAEDKNLLPAVKLLSEQAAAVPAYLDEHMLDIAEWEGAVFGVISSRNLPEFQRRQEENSAYAGWRAVLPPSGGPMRVYYVVITKNGANKEAATFL